MQSNGFVIDLYWDEGRRVWSLCPVRIPRSASGPDVSASSTQIPSKSNISVSKVQLTPRAVNTWPTKLPDLLSNGSSPISDPLDLRQVSESVLSSASPTESVGTITTSAAAGNSPSQLNSSSPARPTAAVSPTNGLLEVGQYACTTSIDLPVIAAVLAEYLSSSQNTLEAAMTYLDLNLHVAATPLDTSPQSLNSSSLPASRELISSLLSVNLSSYLYTPTLLAADRLNLNSSWFTGSNDIQSVYFNTTGNVKGQLMTDNGWPSESLVELRHAYRLLASYGELDPQLNRYNFSGDESVIFPQNAFLNDRMIEYSENESINQGCFFDPSITSISGQNNSWAVSSQILLPDTYSGFDNTTIPSVSSLVSCGVSPLLNQTLLATTADMDAHPYQQVAYSSIWTWAQGEPRNVSSNETNSQNLRCAAMDASQNGRWHVADCSDRKYAACRVRNEPYVWRLSSNKGTYSTGAELCSNGQNFSVPYTALENSHLLSAIQARRSTSDDRDSTIWVNFNSLDTASCWVVGVNTACPYQSNTVDVNNRAVIVPTVAGILVIVITALTVFIKCAANRQNTKSKRRRRAGDGWDYEGVPS
ncbi:hypothetical protein FKW77_003816 [Venturia effusa]|uniref:Maintenance of telomere capping protein 6 n=1 Tax=Venturia effusa TaxID=50376 RepID=A0A517L570_9PEZI|nr:hypothetical protein FKW77_003816 [Venturia effusa]